MLKLGTDYDIRPSAQGQALRDSVQSGRGAPDEGNLSGRCMQQIRDLLPNVRLRSEPSFLVAARAPAGLKVARQFLMHPVGQGGTSGDIQVTQIPADFEFAARWERCLLIVL